MLNKDVYTRCVSVHCRDDEESLHTAGVVCLVIACVMVSLLVHCRDDEESLHTAGVVCLVIACVMIVAGIITAILTCVFAGRAAQVSRTCMHRVQVLTTHTHTYI